MRVFMAIDFSEEIKEYISKVQENVKTATKKGNFVPKDNFHITLHFIGEVERNEIDGLCTALYTGASQNKEFTIKLDELGTFNRGNSSILWLGTEECKPLFRLYNSLSKALSREGYSTGRQGLKPHITLGREVEFYNNFKNLRGKFPIEHKEIKVEKITLMESVRKGPKLIYKPLFTAELKKINKKLTQ